MKTKEEYHKETADLLRIVTSYRAIQLEQVLRFFPKREGTIKALIYRLIKQNRLYLDQDKQLLCDRTESADSPDYGLITALWVLLDFKKSILYHINSDFPTKITFFAQDEVYEIIYVALGQEALIDHAFSAMPDNTANRLVVIESRMQAAKLNIPNTLAFCIVTDGIVNYYQKGDSINE